MSHQTFTEYGWVNSDNAHDNDGNHDAPVTDIDQVEDKLCNVPDVSQQDSLLTHCDEELNHVHQLVEKVNSRPHVDGNFENEMKSYENFQSSDINPLSYRLNCVIPIRCQLSVHSGSQIRLITLTTFIIFVVIKSISILVIWLPQLLLHFHCFTLPLIVNSVWTKVVLYQVILLWFH